MLIVMAIGDKTHLRAAQMLSSMLNPKEKIVSFADFKRKEGKETRDSRLTFIGHGGLSTFGFGTEEEGEKNVAGYSAERFFTSIEEVLGESSPVKIIDLFACNIGLIKNGLSYVGDVKAQAGKKYIINSIQYNDKENEIYSLILTTRFLKDEDGNGSISIESSVLYESEKEQYRKLRSQITEINEEIRLLSHNIQVLEERIAIPNTREEIKEKIKKQMEYDNGRLKEKEELKEKLLKKRSAFKRRHYIIFPPKKDEKPRHPRQVLDDDPTLEKSDIKTLSTSTALIVDSLPPPDQQQNPLSVTEKTDPPKEEKESQEEGEKKKQKTIGIREGKEEVTKEQESDENKPEKKTVSPH